MQRGGKSGRGKGGGKGGKGGGKGGQDAHVAVGRAPDNSDEKATPSAPDASATLARAFTLALSGSEELQMLLSSGNVAATASRPDGMYKGWTLLHAAASRGHAAIVNALLQAGADPAVANAQGKTAAQLAESKGHTAVAAALEAARPTAADTTPSNDEVDVLGELFARGVSLGLLSEAEVDLLTDAVAEGRACEDGLVAEWTGRIEGLKVLSSSLCAPSDSAPPRALTANDDQPLLTSTEPPPPAPAMSASPAALPPAPTALPRAPPPTQSPTQLPSLPAEVTPAPSLAISACIAADEGSLAKFGSDEGSLAIIGLATAMCTESEAAEREACLELSPLEILAGSERERRPRVDLARAVKKYARPAAGAPPPPPDSLRPLPVLDRTVDYLLRAWAERRDVPALTRYVFVADRLRAVQQDMTVQRLSAPPLLARIVRFHLLVELTFCDLPKATEAGYTAVHNRSLLCNALISALEAPTGLMAAPLHAEILSYFALLHADEPATLAPELARAPRAVLALPTVRRALRAVGAMGRGDVPVSRLNPSDAPVG